jgi:hypothetical protein
MTAEQQACEDTFYLTQPNDNPTRWKICSQTSYQEGAWWTWNFSPLCREKITCHWTQTGKESRIEASIPQLHEGVRRLRSHGTSEFPRGEEHMLLLATSSCIKETNSTTKTRVVFDGGAKTSNGLSLSDILQVGPTVQPDLYSNCAMLQNTSGVFHSWHSKDVPSDCRASTRQGSTENPVEIFIWGTHSRIQTNHSHLWNVLSSISGNTMPQEASRWQ